MPPVSLLATLLATVLSFVLGGLWYGPLFAKTWMRPVGVTEATLRENFNPAKTYGITFVLSFLASYVFGMFLGPDPTMALGLGAGAAPVSSGSPAHYGPTICSSADRLHSPPSTPATTS
jgi:Protein of unknown function (DUF1761)